MKTTAERQREITRSMALVHMLRDRMGETSVYGFAGRYDGMMQGASNTQESKKWRPVFSGKQPLTARTLASLSELFPDAPLLHQDGPANLWRAMWGDISAVITCIRSHPKCSPQTPLHLAEKSIEAELLCAGPANLAALTHAVALYRLRLEMEPDVRIDGYGLNLTGCAWRCVETCLKDDAVTRELESLGVQEWITDELENMEKQRIKAKPRALLFD